MKSTYRLGDRVYPTTEGTRTQQERKMGRQSVGLPTPGVRSGKQAHYTVKSIKRVNTDSHLPGVAYTTRSVILTPPRIWLLPAIACIVFPCPNSSPSVADGSAVQTALRPTNHLRCYSLKCFNTFVKLFVTVCLSSLSSNAAAEVLDCDRKMDYPD